ncbi:MAG: RidA family protein [Dehalococcoidia bacterium]
MKKEVINSPKIGPSFSNTTAHGVKAGGFLFVTGQVANPPGIDPKQGREKVGEMGSIEEQAVRVMENLRAILDEAGTNFANVVKRNVYLTHLSDFDPVYKVMERYFTSPVASTGVLTGLIPTSARVEIEVVAIIPD